MSGYNVTLFTKPIEELEYWVCSLCTGVVKQPYDLPCGHLFCKNCLDSSLINSQVCPECRAEIPHVVTLKVCNSVVKLINSWQVKCPRSTIGCSWVDCIGFNERNIHEHEQSCGYHMKACEECHETVQKRLFENHKQHECIERPIQCHVCKNFISFKFKSNHISDTDNTLLKCENVIECPHQCKFKDYQTDECKTELKDLHAIDFNKETDVVCILKWNLSLHNETCNVFEQKCRILGCTYRGRLQDMKKHMETNKDAHILLLQSQVQTIQTQLMFQEEKQEESCEFQFSCTIPNISKLVGACAWDSSELPCTNSNGDREWFALRLKRESLDSTHLGVYLFGTSDPKEFVFCFEIKDVIVSKLDWHVISAKQGQGYRALIPIQTLKDKNIISETNDSITIVVNICSFKWIFARKNKYQQVLEKLKQTFTTF